jgi:hypothetical protein
MTIYYVNTGSAANKGDGDSLRVAFNKINHNFAEVLGIISTSTNFNTGTVGNGYTGSMGIRGIQGYTGSVGIQGPQGLIGYTGSSGLVIPSDIPPLSPTTGELWYDTVGGRTYIYFESTWVDASPPEFSGGNGYTGSIGAQGPQGYVGYTGSSGNDGASGLIGYTGSSGLVIPSDTPPQSPTTGELWYDTVGGRTYIYFDSTWVDSSPPEPSSGGSLSNGAFFVSLGADGTLLLPNGNQIINQPTGLGIASTSGNWTFSNNGKLTVPTYNYTSKSISGTIDTVYGDPYTTYASTSTGETTIYTASGEDIVGLKMTLRIQYLGNLELVEISAVKPLDNSIVDYLVYGSVRTDNSVEDTVIAVNLDINNVMRVQAQPPYEAYFTFTVTEYSKTRDLTIRP